MTQDLDCIERQVGEGADLTIIWLHGLGADGHDFAPLVPELRLPFGARFVFPHAPVRPVTINGGLRMRAWYDILGFGAHVPEDTAGLDDSAVRLRALVDAEIARGQGADRIVVAGFSQGGAVALHYALREPRALAGVVALSTYLPAASEVAGARRAPARPSVLMAHGRADPVIPLMYAEASRDVLLGLGCEVRWHVYDIGHTVCPEEVVDVRVWLTDRAVRPETRDAILRRGRRPGRSGAR